MRMVGEVQISGLGKLKFYLIARLVIMQMIVRNSILIDTRTQGDENRFMDEIKYAVVIDKYLGIVEKSVYF